MKITLNAVIFCLLTSIGYSQTIKYEKTFSEALSKADHEKKLVFLAICAPPLAPNRAYKSGLDDAEVAVEYNKRFISYQVSLTDTASYKLRRKYPSNILPAYFFLDRYGNIIYRNNKNSSLARRYMAMADSAIKYNNTGKTLTDYELAYRSGTVDAASLKEYITLRQKMGIDDNAQLIEDYVKYLPISALDNYQDVLFILKAGPIAYGKAYSLAFINRKLTDSIYKTEPLADRSAMNGRIITATYKEAVAKKNINLIQQLSNFFTNSYGRDYRSSQKESVRYRIAYYQAIKDTANYFIQAAYYYDNYYMNISADSAKKLFVKQSADYLRKLNNSKIISTDSIRRIKSTGGKESVSFSQISAIQNVSNILNTAAYSFYTLGTRNPNNIIKAINWSRRSIELKPLSAYYDTLAHLLYRYGFYAEAEADQAKAIEMANQEKQQQMEERFKLELAKIKNRTL